MAIRFTSCDENYVNYGELEICFNIGRADVDALIGQGLTVPQIMQLQRDRYAASQAGQFH